MSTPYGELIIFFLQILKSYLKSKGLDEAQIDQALTESMATANAIPFEDLPKP